MDRKYRQSGYMNEDKEKREDKPRPATPRDGPRTHKIPPVQQVFRCSLCGTVVPKMETISVTTQCSKCKSDLHTCKNCVHFDTSVRFECNQPIPERIKKKDMSNDCTFFQPRQTLERETTTAPEKISDARAAFDKLFKK